MQREDVTFYSHGARMSAHYYVPADRTQPAPAVVFCPGFTGDKLKRVGHWVACWMSLT